MGSELVNDSSSPDGDGERPNSVSFSFTEIFERYFPYYLSIGMTPEQYWNGDCTLVRYYREAHLLKIQEKNQELWLQGKYFYDALCGVAPVLHAFAKNGTQPIPYMEEPYPITAEEVQARKEREEKKKFEKMKQMTMTWMASVNANIAKKSAGKEDADGGKHN